MNIVNYLCLSILLVTVPAYSGHDVVLPSLASNLVCYYDFGHADEHDTSLEEDLGQSGTALGLVNGGASMRVQDNAYPSAAPALQTKQVDRAANGNDDWKAGRPTATTTGRPGFTMPMVSQLSRHSMPQPESP